LLLKINQAKNIFVHIKIKNHQIRYASISGFIITIRPKNIKNIAIYFICLKLIIIY